MHERSIILHNMTTYVSSSLSSVMLSYILAQMPRHSPQPVEQSNPALRQEQRRVSLPILQFHRTIFSSAFVETSLSRAAVYPLLLSSQDFVDADVDQALIPPSIFAPGGKHGGYGTWQLMTLEEGFQAARNVYWWLPSDEILSSVSPTAPVYMHISAASPALDMSEGVAFSCRKISARVMNWLSERMCLRASPIPMLNT